MSTPPDHDTRSTRPGPDGPGDFDWELGTWRTSVQVLAAPLSGRPDEWLEFEGTSVVRPLLDGRANVVELRVAGAAGVLEGLNLRLWEPGSGRWSATFASVRDGLLTPSVFGGFREPAAAGDGDGIPVGRFVGEDTLDGRAILVRFTIERDGPDRATFTQAFSGDGGVTWETNWVAVDERLDD